MKEERGKKHEKGKHRKACWHQAATVSSNATKAKCSRGCEQYMHQAINIITVQTRTYCSLLTTLLLHLSLFEIFVSCAFLFLRRLFAFTCAFFDPLPLFSFHFLLSFRINTL